MAAEQLIEKLCEHVPSPWLLQLKAAEAVNLMAFQPELAIFGYHLRVETWRSGITFGIVLLTVKLDNNPHTVRQQ